MENLENNNEDDANVHDDDAMNNETGNANEDEDEDNNTGGQVVEEYVSTLADFPRIRNQYGTVIDVDGTGVANPDDIPFCLNIVSYSIQNIPEDALQYCDTLTDVRVLKGGRRRIILRTIGARAFRYASLRRINQFLKEGGVIRLEEGAFEGCYRIEGELIIPNSVVFVGPECFSDCTSITIVVFEPSTMGTIVEINNDAFRWCTELSSAILPPNLERIPRSCFEDCTALINVPIPPTVVELQEDAFAGCTSLPSMELPPTLERIPRSCFRGCTALINVPIPPTVVELEERSFHGCTSLTSMELPESITVIGTKTFFNCTALTTVTIRTTSFNLRMGDDIFGGCTSLSTIWTRPYLWPNIFAAMNKDPAFLFHFFRKYHTTMFDAAKEVYCRHAPDELSPKIKI